MQIKSKQTVWWGIAFLAFVILQIPASWLISKFYKNNQILKNVSGNIWHGQADWKKGQLQGSVEWRTRPLDLVLLRLGADLKYIAVKHKWMLWSLMDSVKQYI